MERNSTTAPKGATTLTIREQWEVNLAAFRAAKADYDAAADAHDADYHAAKAEGRACRGDLAKACDAKGEVESETRFALVLTPAPDFSALAAKYDLLFGDDMFGTDDNGATPWNREYTDAIRSDMARLQSEAASAWLDRWIGEGGSVVIDDEGRLQTAYRADSNHKGNPSGLGEEVDRQEARWHDGHYHGTMTALYDALRMFGGASAIKAHMRSIGARQIAPKEQGKDESGAPAWDVADWVRRFEAVGGYVTPGGGMGWYVFRRPQEDRQAARLIYGEIENCHEREQAVYEYANTPEQVQRYYAALQTGGDA